jgi:hypothetical protein
MSEIGSESLPFHPAFQIDRDRFERDLLDMAEVAGVDVRIGGRIRSVELGDRKQGRKHRLEIERSGQTSTADARWLIDASVRTRILSKQLGLGTSEASHEIAAVWGRFSGLRDIDGLGPESFRERVRFTSRRLSTLHFMCRGYWVWFIPLRGGITSVGVVGERERLAGCRESQRTPSVAVDTSVVGGFALAGHERRGLEAAQQPGELRRWTIDRRSWQLREEKVGDLPGSAEFPVVHPRTVCHPHRFVYAATGFNEGDYVLPNAISRVDTETGDTQSFRFPDTYSIGEPVFAAKAGGREEEGWLLTVAYDDASQKSSLAVLEANDLEGGPVASLQLEHHSPLSFHGCFAPS